VRTGGAEARSVHRGDSDGPHGRARSGALLARSLRNGATAVFAAAMAVLLLAGCGGQAANGTKPAQNLTTAQKDAWLNCGATGPPPMAVLQQPTVLPSITNTTNGAVSDADAQKWVASFVREQVIETWAQTALQDRLLEGGCLGDPAVGTLFYNEITMVQKAQQNQGKVVSELPQLMDIRLVVVPSATQTKIVNQAGAKSAYALVVHGRGPAQTRIDYPNGKQPEIVSEVKTDEAYYSFYGGEYRANGKGLGPLWYQKSAFDCQQDFLRQICGL
jgi:hypothetical protein